MAVVEKITYTSTPEQVAAMHDAFDDALRRVKRNLGNTHPILINGEERGGVETFEVRSPIDQDIVIGHFVAGTKDDVNHAVAAAQVGELTGRRVDIRVGAGLGRRHG